MFYNQTEKEVVSTTSSPYFTPAVIDNACNSCANEIGNPQTFSSQCDICKTMTVKTVSTITYGWFDTIVLFLVPLFFAWVVFLFVKKSRR